ncbi:MAG TPA: hypothetical protein VMD25_00290 [Acidobacteriaceae bacterium]|nr:hypothetical protein [Acidobacteriaceae bacterium]
MLRARALYLLWTVALCALYCLHFRHLLADFPNDSPWMDFSKYTDEGWYANAAIRHFLLGRWYLPGDFNPAVAVPVWPLLLAGVFRFTGVSLAAARATVLCVLGLNLVLVYALIRARAPRWAALLAVTLLLANPFLYAFSRLAILEPLSFAFLLCSWLTALRLPSASARARVPLLILTGFLLCLLVLAKTTGIFLIPSTLFLVSWACGFRLRPTLRAIAITSLAAALPWSAWYWLAIRPRYLNDFRYFFSANSWPIPDTLTGKLAAFWYALHGTLWISPALCITVIVLLLLTLIAACRSVFWRNPLVPASLLAIAGTLFFIGWQNRPAPRYYEAVIFPLCIPAVLAVAHLFEARAVNQSDSPSPPLRARKTLALLPRIAAAAALVALSIVSINGIVHTIRYVRHPQYTWLTAATNLTRYIDTHPAPNRLLLSISGDQIALTTHLPAICDDYGPWDLPYRIHVYQPSWYAAWNAIDDDTLADLQTQFSIEQVAAFPAFDAAERDLLILYRLHPLPADKQWFPAKPQNSLDPGRSPSSPADP